MPTAATTQAARPTPLAIVDHRADARGHALMAALPTSAHSAALEAWICALILALLGNIGPLRHLFPNEAGYDLPEDDEAALRLIRHAIRAENRLRARVAWLVRQHPNRGMCRTFGRITPELRAKPARAPPRAGPHPPKSVLKPPLPAAMTHARTPARRQNTPQQESGSFLKKRTKKLPQFCPVLEPTAYANGQSLFCFFFLQKKKILRLNLDCLPYCR